MISSSPTLRRLTPSLVASASISASTSGSGRGVRPAGLIAIDAFAGFETKTSHLDQLVLHGHRSADQSMSLPSARRRLRPPLRYRVPPCPPWHGPPMAIPNSVSARSTWTATHLRER